jgi:hypothetical protein
MTTKGKTPMLSFKAKFYVAAKKGKISRIGGRFALPTQDLMIEFPAVPSATKAETPIAHAGAAKRTRLGGWRRRISTTMRALWAKRSVPEREGWRRRISTALKTVWVQRRAELAHSVPAEDYQI